MRSTRATALWIILWLAATPVAWAAGSLDDSWHAAYLAGNKIGHIHSLTDRVEAGGQTVIHVRYSMVMGLKRFGDGATMSVLVDSFEFPDGRLYAIDTRSKKSSEETRTTGQLGDDGVFQLKIANPGKTETETVPWSDDILGPYANERLLREDPMKPGQTRSFKTFLPEINTVDEITLKAIRKEKTELRDGSQKELLLVEQTSGKLPIKVSMWVDEQGELIKTLTPMAGLSMTTFKVTRAEALGEPVGEGVDLGYQTLVKVDRPIPNAHATHAVTYRLEMDDEQAANAIPESAYQKIVKREGNTVWVKVSRVTPDGSSSTEKTPAPGPEYLESNGFVQADDAKIVETAQKVVGDATKPWEKVQRLERWVEQNMVNSDFSVAFADAKTVMETRQGDCTEHAVLLAALCRAAGVPSRVAMGLVYLQNPNSFGYHMWTEVYIDGVWYAVDGTLGQGFIGGGHLKLADGSLKGSSAMSTFLPIFSVIGKLKINVEKVE